MSDWLELELAHQLAPTEAPDALWQRVCGAAQARQAPRRRRPVWLPVAAIVTVMVGAGAMWMSAKGHEPGLDLQQLAALDLDAREPLDLNSSDPHEIAQWARREAGIGLSLTPAASAHLAGGRIIHYRGRRIAAVSYQVDGRAAKLLVARAGTSGNASHGGLFWKAGGQSYALAFSATSRAEMACLICHSSL